MRFIDGNKRRLLCRQGEVVNIKVTSVGTAHVVAISLNEQPFEGDSFTVNKDSSMVILGVFSNDTGGGRYDITLTGDPGGDVVDDDIKQNVGGGIRKEGARGYFFTVG